MKDLNLLISDEQLQIENVEILEVSLYIQGIFQKSVLPSSLFDFPAFEAAAAFR